jgi:hypothetical protein
MYKSLQRTKNIEIRLFIQRFTTATQAQLSQAVRVGPGWQKSQWCRVSGGIGLKILRASAQNFEVL